jgi:putative copper export protein
VGAPRLVPLAVAFDTLHVLGAGSWLGTLFVLVVAAFPAIGRGERTTAILERFSPLALGSAALVAATGAFASWLHLERLSALWTTPYGRTLLLKLAILGGVAALGAYNWRVVTPRIRASGDGAALRRTALLELTLAAALIVVTAVLVATPLPAEM